MILLTTAKEVSHLFSTKSDDSCKHINFYPSTAGKRTLPILDIPTVTAAQDMDHYLPVQVQMYLPLVP